MTDIPIPFSGVHPDLPGGQWTRPFTVQQLVEIGLELMEQFLRRVVNAVAGIFIPGVDAFSQLQDWANDIGSAIEGAVNWVRYMVDSLLDALDLPTAEDLLEGIDDLADGIFDFFNDFGSLAFNLLNNPAAVLGSIPQSLVSGLTAALNSATAFIQNVVDAIISGIRRVPIVGGSIANMLDSLTGFTEDTEQTQIQQQQFTISSSSSSVVRQPAWASHTPISAVSYPAILNGRFYVYADGVGPASAGTDHSHEIRGGTDGARAIAPFWRINQGDSRGGFVMADQDVVFSKFSFVGYVENEPENDDDLIFEIFRQEPSGALTRLSFSSVGQHFTTTQKTINLNWTDFRVVARRGERYLLRIKNVGEADCVPWIRGLHWATGAPETQWQTTGADTDKTSYSNGERVAVMNASLVTAWFALAADESEIPESNTWVDDFNRAELGYYWSQVRNDTGGDLVIDDGRLAYGGTDDGYQRALYIRPLASDKFRMDATTVGIASHVPISFWCASGRMGQDGIVLSINATQVELSSVIDGVATVRDSAFRINNNGKWTVTYDPATKTYSVLFDGAATGLSWTDSGELMPKGTSFRYFQIQIERDSGVNAGEVEEWSIQDVA